MSKNFSPTQNQLSINGLIERVTFHSEESGFCVLKVKISGKNDLVPVTGNAAFVTPGEYIECQGTWINDLKHGLQFKAKKLITIPPTTKSGIKKYLGSGMVKGIGPHFADKLVNAFGEDVFNIIEKNPEKLKNISGIGKKRLDLITNTWDEQKEIRKIMIFLHSYAIGTSKAVRIYKTYGNNAILKVTENPYRLSQDIYGIGFKTTDELAMKLGVSKTSLFRAQAGIIHTLKEISNDGHCASLEEGLLNKTSELLNIPNEIIQDALKNEIINGNLIREKINNELCIFLTPLYNAEIGIAKNIKRLLKGKVPWEKINQEEALSWVEKKDTIKLSKSQQKAVCLALTSKVLIITGGPGVGKTTTVNSILKILTEKCPSVLLCAPTGRAAKKLTESTGLTAKTIHRALEFDPKFGDFKRKKENPIEADIIVVDETSMVDTILMNKLLRAINDKTALIIVGDVDQLPSVGPGAILSDMINSMTIPTISLTEIFRQAATSSIIVNAHRINKGEFPKNKKGEELTDFYFIEANTPETIYKKLMKLVTERIPERFSLDPIKDIQVLTPMNKGGLGTISLNKELQKRLNKNTKNNITRFGTSFSEGDKIIQTINNYDKDIFNGDIGNITTINNEESYISIDFYGRLIEYDFSELDEIALAYATTIHKSQGSEYPAVVIPLSTQHFTMLERNLIYTAVTRGKKLVAVIGQPKALLMAIKNKKSLSRLTKLSERLTDNSL